MKTINGKTQFILALIALSLLFNTGCGEGAKLKPIYNSAILGAIVGGIVGYQSDETGEGVAIGASVFALGEILSQIDDNPSPQKQKDESTAKKTIVREKIKETYIIQIHNDNGSITPVEIIKDGDRFIGPTGEQYDTLPTEEQLKPFYGL
ncbi:MAG: hypothetical protein JXA96_14780 [Sedimentisphaerales bacterium]|nr:hypothetical protein [Sedimentisphaerales bacterium]